MMKFPLRKWIPAGIIAVTLVALPGCGGGGIEPVDEATQKAQEEDDPSGEGGAPGKEKEPGNPADEAK